MEKISDCSYKTKISKHSNHRVIRHSAMSLDWSGLNLKASIPCMFGVAVTLIAGFLMKQPKAGVIAAGGAMSVGFGAFEKRYRTRTATMLLGSLAMGLSTFAGSLTGGWVLGSVVIAGLWGLGGGMLVAISSSASYVGVKAMVAVLMAGGYPSKLSHAALRSGLVLAGGLMQTLITALADKRITKWGEHNHAPEPLHTIPNMAKALCENFRPQSPVLQHALRLAFVLALSDWLYRVFGLQNGYWLPMTAMLVLKLDSHGTYSHGLARIVGTLAGAGLATLLVATLRPDPVMLGVLAVLFAGLCYSLWRVNYALYAVCITASVVFLFSFAAGLPDMSAVSSRVVDTMLGGIVSMLVFALWPTKEKNMVLNTNMASD